MFVPCINPATLSRSGVVSLEYMAAGLNAGQSGTFLAPGDIMRGGFEPAAPVAFVARWSHGGAIGAAHDQYACHSLRQVAEVKQHSGNVRRWRRVSATEGLAEAVANVRAANRLVAGANAKTPALIRAGGVLVAAALGDADAIPEAVAFMARILASPEGGDLRRAWGETRRTIKTTGFRLTL